MALPLRNVLVIDDDPAVGESLRGFLEASGYGAVVKATAREALQQLTSEPLPFAILLDLLLPDMGGDEFLSAMREIPRLRDIPVIVTSGWARKIEPPVEVAAWLPKPVEPRDLVEVLERIWRASGG